MRLRGRARWLLLAALGTATGCAGHVARRDLLAQIEAGAPPPIVDVRTDAEYTTSHVPGAVHVPFYTLLFHRDEIPARAEASQPVVLYCEHGPRAGMARAQLWLVGFGPVAFLEGHMLAWKQDGLPVETGSGRQPEDGAAPGSGRQPDDGAAPGSGRQPEDGAATLP